VLALRTYYNSYLGADKARSASGRPTTRDAQHPESGVLNSYHFSSFLLSSLRPISGHEDRSNRSLPGFFKKRKLVRLMVELDQPKMDLEALAQPLMEVRDSL
jgi:hypothetical protein